MDRPFSMSFKARLLPKVLLAIFTLFITQQVSAIPYYFTGTARGPGGLEPDTVTYNVSGYLDISDTPHHMDIRTYNNGEPVYEFRYRTEFSFNIAGEILIGSGSMLIRDTAGLFDALFADNAIYADDGNVYAWDARDGEFFYRDATPYPAWYEDSLAYLELPATIEFYGSRLASFRTGPTLYNFDSTLTAHRIGIPEPSTLVLFALGLLPLIYLSRSANSAVTGIR